MPSTPSISSSEGAEFGEQFEINSTTDEIERIERLLMERLREHQYEESAVFAVRLAFQEAATNARVHGNAMDAHKHIRINLDVQPQRVTISVEDEGDGFNPDAVPDPTEQENLEIPSGRGLTLIRAFMSEVEVVPPGNRVHMTYSRS